ncbi:MAG: ROK family protein [Actinomycetota bacterium]|nr:ROK family protein [Actinomycetota bacterium]
MSANRVIGVDLGGTKILAGVIDADGRVHETVEHPTVTTSQAALLDELAALVRELPQDEVGAVGFGIPSRIDQRNGIALGAVNIPLRDAPFRVEMERRLGLPISMENDASSAAYAEFLHGAGRGTVDLVMLTLGTGVGGGVVAGGKLFRAWTELGHMVIVEDGEPCQGACSGRGHLEAYCSGRSADRLARTLLGARATAHDLVEQQHPVLDEVGHHLGVAIGSLVNIFAPERVVIGGGFGVAAFELLMPAARLAVLTEALAPAGQEVEIELAELGADAGLIGAGLLAFEALQ